MNSFQHLFKKIIKLGWRKHAEVSGDVSWNYSIDVELLRKSILPTGGGKLVVEKIVSTGSLHFFRNFTFWQQLLRKLLPLWDTI